MSDIYKRLIGHFGNQIKTAKALGVKQSSVSAWASGVSKMSPTTAIAAEKATEGEFNRKELCPDFPWSEI